MNIAFHYVFIMLLILALGAFFFFQSRTSSPKSCFNPQNFDRVWKYTLWKEKTSKIGKVLIHSFRVESSPKQELIFRKDRNGKLIFKVNRAQGLIFTNPERSSRQKKKAEVSFCELLKRANFKALD